MQFDKEFKEAIANMSSAEKDKIILRLLKHDLILAERLNFELVDNRSVDQVRETIENNVVKSVKLMSERFYSPGYLMVDMRYLSGEITEHVTITKDKYGEVSLNLLMLNEVLNQNHLRISNATKDKAYKLCIYIIARSFKILILIDKLHEDLFMEFRESLEQLGENIGKTPPLMQTAINNGFDVNWLLSGDIPENIAAIHTEIRKSGFLK